MKFPELIQATLIKRYKRFLADVTLLDGKEITVHCPNTGAMTGCAESGNKVWLSQSDNPKRKYPHTWELAQTPKDHFVCIHSVKANALVKEAIDNSVIEELQGYKSIQSEVKYGDENSRIDILLKNSDHSCYVEVKSVTLLVGSEADEGLGIFPDAVSDRGRKHLRELIAMKQLGHRAVLFFCVQHTGIERVAPADSIDADYGRLFRQAIKEGVEVLAYQAQINLENIILLKPLSVVEREPTS